MLLSMFHELTTLKLQLRISGRFSYKEEKVQDFGWSQLGKHDALAIGFPPLKV